MASTFSEGHVLSQGVYVVCVCVCVCVGGWVDRHKDHCIRISAERV